MLCQLIEGERWLCRSSASGWCQQQLRAALTFYETIKFFRCGSISTIWVCQFVCLSVCLFVEIKSNCVCVVSIFSVCLSAAGCEVLKFDSLEHDEIELKSGFSIVLRVLNMFI
mgnify:CR=1 FL=1